MAIPCDMLLHPELLTTEQLIHVIQERQLKIPNLHAIPREDLVELFHNYCVPFGQRKYRDSGRGKMLNKTRQLSPEPCERNNFIPREQSRKSQLTNHDRIKAPPDLLAGHMKRIKLESTPSENKNDFFIKRKIADCMISESPPSKKQRNQITWP